LKVGPEKVEREPFEKRTDDSLAKGEKQILRN
jgi:hypothetical protein